ncbi:hypothetical protein [Achromobacter animicus]|uniref:hypothetical protein n=1 Tax=Achromobacter animicus TaxID=1389935 RepID=UPI00345E2CAA
MTRQLYYGKQNAPNTLEGKLGVLRLLARFAESHDCSVAHVLQTQLINDFSTTLRGGASKIWLTMLSLYRKLDIDQTLGFSLSPLQRERDLRKRVRLYRENHLQTAPLPTRIYGALITSLSLELKDVEEHASRLLAALSEAVIAHGLAEKKANRKDISIGPGLVTKYGLQEYLTRRGFSVTHRVLHALSGAITEAFQLCKLQIHVFTGMRHGEARSLPYHCMVTRMGEGGKVHCLIAGATTKFNRGMPLRAHWVTTDQDGSRAVRLAQKFASFIYRTLEVKPSRAEKDRDLYPLFLSTDLLPWGRRSKPKRRIRPMSQSLYEVKPELAERLCPIMVQEDVAELEDVDQCRAWRDEPRFRVGNRWPLATHQLRRSLALYANSSGLVDVTSLRRQLQHITREMSMYYGKGSTFCKDFLGGSKNAFNAHMSSEWLQGEKEAIVALFYRDVLNTREPLFGGAGMFFQKQKDSGVVISRDEVMKDVAAGLFSYRPSPFGGCTKTGACDQRKGPTLFGVLCVTENCKNLVGKHSKLVSFINLWKKAISRGESVSIEAQAEMEDLIELEKVERVWRLSIPVAIGGKKNV